MLTVNKYILILMSLLSVNSQVLLAQTFIKGTLVDSIDGRPLSGGRVDLSNENDRPVQTVSTAKDGSFTLRVTLKGSYSINFSYVGYKTYLSNPIYVGKDSVVKLGRVLLVPKSQLLGDVIIKSKKRPLEIKDDKLVYNASADIANKTGSASDVLRKAPMVTVGADGEVKLRGSSNIKVLLNGMPSGILAKNLKEALKTIPANTIQSVEVITSPSAKYEAEGAAGVINIITKKKLKGTSGTVDIVGGNLEQAVNGSLNHATGKFNFNLSVNGISDYQKKATELARKSFFKGNENGSLYQQGDGNERTRGGFGEFSVDYRPDSSQKLSLNSSFWKGKWPTMNNLYNLYKVSNSPIEYKQKSNESSLSQFTDLSLNYQKKFKRTGQELQLIGQYGNMKDESSYLTEQFSVNNVPYFSERSPNTGKSKDYSVQADYIQPLNHSGNTLLETGIRYSRTNSNSDYHVFNNQDEPGRLTLREDPSRANRMKYFQQVFAGYVSLKFKPGNNWSIRPGLRYESSHLHGDFKQGEPSFGTTFNNFVPNLMVIKKIGDSQDLKFDYTERIRRPWIWDLNPYMDASDPLNITYGNPRLKPELTRMFEAGYTYNILFAMLNTSLYYHSNNNSIESLSSADSLGVSRTTSQNIATNRRLGTNLNAYLQFSEQFGMQGGIDLYRVWFKSRALNVSNIANFYSFNFNTYYTLPKDFSLLLSGDYSNGDVYLQGRNSANYTYSFSASKEFMKKKASLTFSANNFFRKNLLQRSITAGPTFESNLANRYYNRSFSLTFSWRFGKTTSKETSEDSFSDKHPEERPMRKH